jgi:hypothetical protein
LSDPAPAGPALDGDPLAVLARALDRVERDLAALPPAAVAARRLGYATLGQLSAKMEGILSKRPRMLKPDEVHEAIRGEMDTAIAKLLKPVAEAEAKLRRDRAELETWAAQELAPRTAQELLARVDAMFGGPWT